MRNVPKLRFKEFTDEWEKIKLKEILEFKNGINASKEQYGKGIKFINVLDILNNDFITYDNIIGKVDIDEKTLEKYSVNYGDILFQRSSETREEVGMANVYLDGKTATFGGFVIRGKKIANYVPTFINKVLKTDLARNEITSKSGGSTRYNVGQDILNEVQIVIPNLQEQQKIADFLSSVDKKISITEEKLNLFNEYKKGIMQKIFNQELRFKDENGNDYSEWEEKKLEEIADCLDNKRKPLNSTEREKIKGNIPYYGANGIQGYINDYLFDEELVLLAEDGGNFEDFSIKPIAQYIHGKSWINNHAHILKGKKEVLTKFLFYSLVHKDIRSFINGTSRSKLNKSDMLNIIINLPCFEEQQKISDFLSAIDTKIEKISDELKNLKEFKKGLLQQMFV